MSWRDCSARQNWKPFIFGITKSSSTRSNGTPSAESAPSAVMPSLTAVTSKPCRPKIADTTFRIVALSSTTRMRWAIAKTF
jgi:hypothetical protein